MDNVTKIAFIGFGEAGGILAAGLKENGANVVATYDILIDDPASAPAHIEKAESHGVLPAASMAEALGQADVIISAVVTTEMLAAAEAAAPHLRPGQYYLDINSTSPEKKRKAAKIIDAAGGHYVESAVMDLVPPKGIATPMLLSGAKAEPLAEILREFGMDLTVVGADIGNASSLKMVRSVFMKGFTSILLECLVAAHKLDAKDVVLKSLQGTFPQIDWDALCDYYAPRLINHSKRQGLEMYSVADTLKELGVEPITAMAIAQRLGWLGDMDLKSQLDALPETMDEMLDIVARETAKDA